MEHVIIYKKGRSLKEKMQDVRFSYQRTYEVSFATETNGLKKLLNEFSESLLFFFSDHLTQEERIIVRNIQNALPKIYICLCSDSRFAMDAWHLEVSHFINMPVTSDAMVKAYRKYIRSEDPEDHALHLKTKEGLIKVPINDINYIKASGNYSIMHISGDRAFMQTNQLQHYETLNEKNRNLVRVHRSLILNLKRIRKIGANKISFYHSSKDLEISKSLEMKIKKLLLGMS